MSRQHTSGSASCSEADGAVMQRITQNVDIILAVSETDASLRLFALKFQIEQAADKAAFESAGKGVDRIEHMQRVLERMADLGLAVALHVLHRTLKDSTGGISSQRGCSTSPLEGSLSRQTFCSNHKMQRPSSVETFVEGTEAWLEQGAHLSFAAIELLSLLFVAHPRLCEPLQMFLSKRGIVSYLTDALTISRDHELDYFQEGYKTEHMRLIANLSFQNALTSAAIVAQDGLLRQILSATRIDEENPGMVQWAEFTIRNLCNSSPEARDVIKKLTPMGLTEESEKMLSGRVIGQLPAIGKA